MPTKPDDFKAAARHADYEAIAVLYGAEAAKAEAMKPRQGPKPRYRRNVMTRDIVAAAAAGQTFARIAKATGLSRSAIAGIVWRDRARKLQPTEAVA